MNKATKNTADFFTAKKLVVLAILLMTLLSASLINDPAQTKNAPISEELENIAQKETLVVQKLKAFNAKEYLKNYERKKRAKEMLNHSLKQFAKF